MRLLDRHVLATFAAPFLYCLSTFLAIWLLFDLVDNAPDFFQREVSLAGIVGFYLGQLPYIGLIVLPVGLLLGVLYTLGKLSRSNELMSMLGAGVGFTRIVMPLFLVGLAATAASQWMSYEAAPRADATRQESIQRLANKEPSRKALTAHLFRNRIAERTWFVEKMPLDDREELSGLEVTQQHPSGRLISKTYAATASYDSVTRIWQLRGVKLVEYNEEGVLIRQQFPERLAVTEWEETPWRLRSSNLRARHLTVPELERYLQENADFPDSLLAPFRTYLLHRHALPWTCFLVVLIGAPLGFVQGRRGMLGGIATAIVLFFAMLFFTNLFLALGQGGRIAPWLAAWGPNLIFGLIGLFLFYVKSTNIDFCFFFKTCRKKKKILRGAVAARPA